MANATANLLHLATQLSAHATTLQSLSTNLSHLATSLETEAADLAEERARLVKLAQDAANKHSFNVDVNVGIRPGGGVDSRHLPGCGACQSAETEPLPVMPEQSVSRAVSVVEGASAEEVGSFAGLVAGRTAGSSSGSKASSPSGGKPDASCAEGMGAWGTGWGPGNNAQASFNVTWGSPIACGKK